MPSYLVTDSLTGKKYRLTGDSPPTEEELSGLFGEQPQEQQTQGEALSEVPSLEEQKALTHTQTTIDTGQPKSLEVGFAPENLLTTVKNIPSNAIEAAKSMYQGVTAIPTIAKGLYTGDVTPSQIGTSFMGELKNKYGSPYQIRETLMTRPVETAMDVSMILGMLGGASKLAGKIGRSSTLGNIGGALGEASTAVDPLAATARAVSGPLGKAKDWVAQQTYIKAMKPSTTLSPQKRAWLADTALKENVPITKGAVERNWNTVNALDDEIKTNLGNLTANNNLIRSSSVADDLSKKMTEIYQKNPLSDDIGAIKTIKDNFGKKLIDEDAYGKLPTGQQFDIDAGKIPPPLKDLTPSQAWAKVQDLNKELNAYYKAKGKGEIIPQPEVFKAKQTLRESLIRHVEELYPEVKTLTGREHELIELNKELARAVNRIGNRNWIGLLPALGGIGGAVMGSPIAGLLLSGILVSPSVSNKLARVLYRTGKGSISQTLGKLPKMPYGPLLYELGQTQE